MCTPLCGNCCDLVPHILGKNFVKLTSLLKKLQKSWFDEIFFLKVGLNCSFFHTVPTSLLCSSKWYYANFLLISCFFLLFCQTFLIFDVAEKQSISRKNDCNVQMSHLWILQKFTLFQALLTKISWKQRFYERSY